MRLGSWLQVALLAIVALVWTDATRSPARRLPVLVETPTVEADEDLPQRPRTRGKCDDVPRPCPFVSCRYSLFSDFSKRTGQLRLNRGVDVEPGDVPADESCALDVADEGGVSQEQVARLLGNVTLEWCRQVERTAEAGMRVRGGPELAALLEGGSSGGTCSQGEALTRAGQKGPARLHVRDLAAIEAGEEAAREAWTERVVALARAGVPLRAAWAIASRADGRPLEQLDEDDGDEPSESDAARLEVAVDDEHIDMVLDEDEIEHTGAAAPTENTSMTNDTTKAMASEKASTRAQREALRGRVLAELEGGPADVAALARRLGVDVGPLRDALRRLRIHGKVESDNRGTRSRWSLVSAAATVSPGFRDAHDQVLEQHGERFSRLASAPAPERPAPGVEASLVLELLRADDAKLERVERLLERIGGTR